MDELPQVAKAPSPSMMPYIWAALIFMLLSGVFILSILWLRPNLDPLILITTVFGIAGTMFSGVAAFLKSQETHASVNGQLSSWKNEFYAMAHAQGMQAGAEVEQARITEQLRLKTAANMTAIPVVIVPKPSMPPEKA